MLHCTSTWSPGRSIGVQVDPQRFYLEAMLEPKGGLRILRNPAGAMFTAFDTLLDRYLEPCMPS